MDVEEANKFINALVKNLQVLCHGHVNFNSSIQVIGHLYLNVDSDTNIDYIVNEKVCKSDSSSTVFVSKSYHSEPKSPVKPPQSNNRSDSTKQNILPVSIPSLSQPLSKRRPVPKRISSKNIHPAYRDNISSFESPVKIPRLSLGDFKASTPIDAKQQAGEEIDLCIVKQEPGVESSQKEDLHSADHSNVPGPSFDRSSDESNQNEQTYSNQFNKSSIPVPVELHDNNSDMDMKLDTVFSQSLDTSSSMASPQFGSFDGSSIDNNLKTCKERTRKQIASALRSRRYRERKRAKLEGRDIEEKVTPKKEVKDKSSLKVQGKSKVNENSTKSLKKVVKGLLLKETEPVSKCQKKSLKSVDVDIEELQVQHTPSDSKTETKTRKSSRLNKSPVKEGKQTSQSENLEKKQSPSKSIQSQSKVKNSPIKVSPVKVRDSHTRSVLSEAKEDKIPSQDSQLKKKSSPITIKAPNKLKPEIDKGIQNKSITKRDPIQEVKETPKEKDSLNLVRTADGTKSSKIKMKVSSPVQRVLSDSPEKDEASPSSSSISMGDNLLLQSNLSGSTEEINSTRFSKKDGKDSPLETAQLEPKRHIQTLKRVVKMSPIKDPQSSISNVDNVPSAAQGIKDDTPIVPIDNTQSTSEETFKSTSISWKERKDLSIESTHSESTESKNSKGKKSPIKTIVSSNLHVNSVPTEVAVIKEAQPISISVLNNSQSKPKDKTSLNELCTFNEIPDLFTVSKEFEPQKETVLTQSASSSLVIEKDIPSSSSMTKIGNDNLNQSSMTTMNKPSTENNQKELTPSKRIRIKIIAKPVEDKTVKPVKLRTELQEAQDFIRARNRVRQQELQKKKKQT